MPSCAGSYKKDLLDSDVFLELVLTLIPSPVTAEQG